MIINGLHNVKQCSKFISLPVSEILDAGWYNSLQIFFLWLISDIIIGERHLSFINIFWVLSCLFSYTKDKCDMRTEDGQQLNNRPKPSSPNPLSHDKDVYGQSSSDFQRKGQHRGKMRLTVTIKDLNNNRLQEYYNYSL